MNEVKLKGIIRNIQYSHNIGDITYDKAELIVNRSNGQEDLINIKFKRFSNLNMENDEVALKGNIRTFTDRLEDRNVVQQYVFTYFDEPKFSSETATNEVIIDGEICKLNDMQILSNGKHLIRFVILNKIEKSNTSLNSYIHCVAFGRLAKIVSTFKVGDNVVINGEMHSHTYKKAISEDNFELRLSHEVFVTDINKKEKSTED